MNKHIIYRILACLVFGIVFMNPSSATSANDEIELTYRNWGESSRSNSSFLSVWYNANNSLFIEYTGTYSVLSISIVNVESRTEVFNRCYSMTSSENIVISLAGIDKGTYTLSLYNNFGGEAVGVFTL